MLILLRFRSAGQFFVVVIHTAVARSVLPILAAVAVVFSSSVPAVKTSEKSFAPFSAVLFVVSVIAV